MLEFAIAHPILAYLATGIPCAAVFTGIQSWLLPLRIPRAEIGKLADELITHFGSKAAYIAVLEQDRAVHNSDPFEQGKWWRVEREIKRRR